MATFGDIGLAAGVNILSALVFLIAFAILRLQPFNDRVYFPKWYLKGLRSNPAQSGVFVSKFVNLDWRAYIRFLNWVPDALKMPEPELIDHAGLDSAVYLRIYLLGDIACMGYPSLSTGQTIPWQYLKQLIKCSTVTLISFLFQIFHMDHKVNLLPTTIDLPTTLGLSKDHIVMALPFVLTLLKEYETVAEMRLHCFRKTSS
ncbi:UNVERIFIED_CONTAM: CSC1-like protein [Sesamum calycinum]|uniref:CSC1-like protein n=1 Tax=Sesamum calycinum TaxID=2727403 RepID=A0AAW2Q5W2_9LAMI